MSETQNYRILALDTSTEACSAAVLTPEAEFVEFDVCPREHNKRILVMAEQVLAQAKLTLADIDFIAYGKGPGSFTGVRIATGIVQGMAFGADKPVVGISSLAAMAHALYREYKTENVISAIDARMNEIYLGAYQTQGLGLTQVLIDEVVCPPQNALNHLDKSINWQAVGTGWQTYHDLLTEQINAQISTDIEFPNALDIAYLALTEFKQGKFTSADKACPSYVRDQVTWQKLPGK
ncbi:tRNA (adenosine(37)-N6)-threonylcarbamoyltransferase complex dimerization subunit type 1 TsaB [Catenovulum sp. 2E275]|uniref:tRNA (adenosine(37)-N6)-threonylcarbamoyltransferase complex dimerization subunit type 1 TsaB n=1 Tax=Catenovulum sp. 2E275 TaxID=2980497 RepID=UPI0021CDFF4B|nr:tRNA (adenosine(37)-N6)-threonylcarbamoyltransferase complex dimerization subunit type 1 TsaB [Catenovulum sp. 2E275]MCU4676972.1 tRNA (adenosine(37)-N6)-threonylcarbamoyltransferase complex dimerization subunit type 1 TsaB [Catenovulum sp. 2E275]